LKKKYFDDEDIVVPYDPETIFSAVWLHDTLEDTKATIESLREAEFNQKIICAVEALTRTPDKEYFESIMNITSNVNHSLIKKSVSRKIRNILYSVDKGDTELSVIDTSGEKYENF